MGVTIHVEFHRRDGQLSTISTIVPDNKLVKELEITRTQLKVLERNDPRMLPVFTIEEAAAYLNVPRTTFQNWTREDGHDALVTSFRESRRQANVPFIGLAEGLVLAAFRRAGVPLQRIRPALAQLDNEFGIGHALASERLYTDGAEVLYDYPRDDRGGDLRNLIVVRSGQRIFTDIVRQYLQRISYANDGWAKQLRLPGYEKARVIVDPARAFGRPLVEHGGARLEDIVDRFAAGDSLSELSKDFAVSEDEIEDLIRGAIRPKAA